MRKMNITKYNKYLKAEEYNKKDGYINYLGNMVFCMVDNEIKLAFFDDENLKENMCWLRDDEELKQYKERTYLANVYDMMSGIEFLNCVNSGCISDYDGQLSNIYIDGYKSNLGLFHEGMTQGGFLVDYDMFKEICEEYHVLVDWANK